jgi:putative membrane protein
MIEYDPHNWFDHLFAIRGSMVREILGRVMTCVAWSAVVVLLHSRYPALAIPLTLHTLVGTALGLLLVFRTNASNDRYWEGRRLWGGIVNTCRNLTREASAVLGDEPGTVRDVVRWTEAYAYACRGHLRGTPDLGPPGSRLPAAEVEAVLAARHVPLAVAGRITALLDEARRRGRIDTIQFASLDDHLTGLIDLIGGCERIHRTPLPFAYMVHLRRALILYCFSLPFGLVREFGWVTILDTLFVAYIFFGIEEIGVEIEDPFGEEDNDLPLGSYCAQIEAVLEDHLRRAESG